MGRLIDKKTSQMARFFLLVLLPKSMSRERDLLTNLLRP